jgi:hypothetical protein
MNTPVVLDIEASGFGADSYPIEIGVALADGTEHSWLIKPLNHWQHWRQEAQAVHGLSREYLHDEGLPPAQVADALNELLLQQTAYSDAWGFDRSWLAKLFHDTGRYQGFKLDAIFTLLNEDQLHRWRSCRETVTLRTGLKPHRAGSDATMIQQTLSLVKTGMTMLTEPAG